MMTVSQAAARPSLLRPATAAALDDGPESVPKGSNGSSSANCSSQQSAAARIAALGCQVTAQIGTSGAASHRQQGYPLESNPAASSSDVECSSSLKSNLPEASKQCQDGTEWENENQLHALDDGLGQLFLAGAEEEPEQVGPCIPIRVLLLFIPQMTKLRCRLGRT